MTGAGGTIGCGIAEALCKQGAKVFITDLCEDKLSYVCENLSDVGCCHGLRADITKYDEVEKVIMGIKDSYGPRIDILANVAGLVGQKKVEDIGETEWDTIFDVNCKGSFFFVKKVVPFMKDQGAGKIINFSSKSGKTGSALMSHYSAAKAAIIGFTQALAYELAGNRINVNCVCPGITENTGVWSEVSSGYVKNLDMSFDEVVKAFSEKVPLQRLATVRDIVAVTLFLASEGADYMTGQAINVTGGREMH